MGKMTPILHKLILAPHKAKLYNEKIKPAILMLPSKVGNANAKKKKNSFQVLSKSFTIKIT